MLENVEVIDTIKFENSLYKRWWMRGAPLDNDFGFEG